MSNRIIDSVFNEEFSDRRMDSRINLEVPVEFEYDDKGKITVEKGTASFISRKGLTLSSPILLSKNSEIVLKISIPNLHVSIRPTARVSWITSNSNKIQCGVQFVHLSQIYTPYFNQFLNKKITSGNVQERRVKSEIISELVEYKNRSGKRIVAFLDRMISTTESAPYIIIPSSYGETKINAIHTSFFLAKNGLNVLRFDVTNHIGESDGDHVDYTLENVKNDISSSIDFLERKSPDSKIGIVASSLSARASIKLLSQDKRPRLLISVVGIVNVQDTFKRVQNEDLIDQFIKGKRFGRTNILGFEVNGDQTIEASISGKFFSLESTIQDINSTLTPIVFLVGNQDPWVDSTDMYQIAKLAKHPDISIKTISTMHRLKENPAEAKKAFSLITQECLNLLQGLKEEIIREPSTREIGSQVRLERERSKHLMAFSQEEQKFFWSDYLRRFHYIHSIADYRDLLNQVIDEFGTFNNNDAVFDAGCGNGNFGLWLIKKLAETFETSNGLKKLTVNYIGGDIVDDALKHSFQIHKAAQTQVKEKYGLHRDFLISSYQKIDMNNDLPFMSNSFDKIACNLVVSYLENPYKSIKELIRVLKPGGKLIITNLKKDADISRIYRNFIEKAKSEDEIEEAKNLLSNSGKILAKEAEGYFRFFTQDEISKLATQIHSKGQIKVTPCFSNQAVMLVVKK